MYIIVWGSNRLKKDKKKPTKYQDFDKYFYYTASVQSAENDAAFMAKTYEEIRGKKAQIMREDFCGTFALSCEWVKLDPSHISVGVDLDPEPLAYGKANYLPKLTPNQAKRLSLHEKDVLRAELPPADLVCALNFSYFIFKERKVLGAYFKHVLESLRPDGALLLDCFGGSRCYEANEEETEHEDNNFSYFWDQENYDPITNHAMFHIHFRRHGEAKRKKVFSYDWRLWSIPELRDLLLEAGFSSVKVYWEGTDTEGEGDGEFTEAKVGEECESWIAYIVGLR